MAATENTDRWKVTISIYEFIKRFPNEDTANKRLTYKELTA